MLEMKETGQKRGEDAETKKPFAGFKRKGALSLMWRVCESCARNRFLPHRADSVFCGLVGGGGLLMSWTSKS